MRSDVVIVASYDCRIRRRCTSPKTMMWSTHSRRIDPISRSAKPFCQGEAGAVGLSRMPMARNPFCRRICCDVDPDEVSAVEPDDDESIEQVETDSWNNEQVHGGNVRRVVTQEGSPSLAGWPPSFYHVLRDTRLRDLKPELEQFAVDAWRAPKRIFDAHPPDQYAQLRVDLRSPSLWARLPTPVAAKAGPVPTHERLGPDDCENLQD